MIKYYHSVREHQAAAGIEMGQRPTYIGSRRLVESAMGKPGRTGLKISAHNLRITCTTDEKYRRSRMRQDEDCQ